MFIEFVFLVLLVLILAQVGAHLGQVEKRKDFPPSQYIRNWSIWELQFGFGFPQLLAKLQSWKQRHGDLFNVQVGANDAIILHGQKLIKDVFTDSKFNGRSILGSTKQIGDQSACGIMHAEGKVWSQQRKFTVKNFRDLGVGKQSLENMIHEELSELVIHVKQTLGRPVNIRRELNMVVLNSLWHLVTGDRHSSLSCSNLARFEKNINLLTKETNRVIFGALNPSGPDWVNKLLAFTGSENSEAALNELRTNIRKELKHHNETFEESNIRDFMDLYIREIHDTDDEDSSFYKNVGEQNAVQTIVDLLIGGTEPTSNALNWALFFISRNSNIQKKLQDEIDTVIGHFHPSSVNDKLKMPYTEAVILEILRLTSATSHPLTLPHATTEDLVFQNYTFPKGTAVVGNLFDLHFDERTWTNPTRFHPERFLKSKGFESEINKNLPPVCPFSVGRRACPGETFAKDIIFLFLTTMFQRFHVHAPNGEIGRDSFTLNDLSSRTLSRFKIIFEDRLEFLDRATLDEHDK